MSKKEIVEAIVHAFRNGNKLMICGNGGSSAEGSHFAEELISHGYPAIALNDPAVITALANDFSYKEVFSRYVMALGKRGDVLVTLSTSGKSKNIQRAIKAANKMGIVVIEWPRNKGKTTEQIQNEQLKLIHQVYQAIIR